MKKIIAILLVTVICLSVCSCGKSENVIAAENAVKAIGIVTLESENAIKQAEAAVAKLTKEEKTNFNLQDELEEAKEAYKQLTEQKLIDETIAAIEEIEEITLDNKDDIEKAQKKYDKLSADGKAKVSNYEKLDNALKIIEVLYKEEKERIIAQKTSLFSIEEDRVEGITWYQPKNMPNYIDIRSYIIPYIGERNNNVWLCIRYNYTADDWIFWESLTIMVDGNKYYKTPSRNELTRDNDTEVWEYYDECLDYNLDTTDSKIQMLKAISESEETIIRFQGDEYHYDLTVTATDKKMIADTLALYEAMLD